MEGITLELWFKPSNAPHGFLALTLPPTWMEGKPPEFSIPHLVKIQQEVNGKLVSSFG